MTREQKWLVYKPSTLDKALAIDSAAQAIYLRHPLFHYDVVLAVRAPSNVKPYLAAIYCSVHWLGRM